MGGASSALLWTAVEFQGWVGMLSGEITVCSPDCTATVPTDCEKGRGRGNAPAQPACIAFHLACKYVPCRSPHEMHQGVSGGFEAVLTCLSIDEGWYRRWLLQHGLRPNPQLFDG